MLGYWNRPEETALAIRNGWFHTGDVAVMDPDGYFRIVDRLKEMILVSGFNVYPNEIEDALYRHPAIWCRRLDRLPAAGDSAARLR